MVLFKQARNICFTYFCDYSEEKEQEISTIFEDGLKASYMVFQFEICPKTNKTHVQGYAEFGRGMRPKTIIKRLPGVHLEARAGTALEAAEYCMDPEKRMPETEVSEFGVSRGGQGRRTDLAAVAEMVAGGASDRTIAEEDPVCFMRHYRGIRVLRSVLAPLRRLWVPEIRIIWGEPGTGKTRSVYEEFKFDDIYQVCTPRSGSEVWFDGYIGQKVILVDDFYGWFRWSFLLKFTDRYPQQLPIKCGYTENLARFIIFTSNQPPQHWYAYNAQMVWGALERRVSTITEIKFPEEEQE